jgi:hypothetical protein
MIESYEVPEDESITSQDIIHMWSLGHRDLNN